MHNNINTYTSYTSYTCQYCRREYQSDTKKKPRSYRKDGSVYQYYDATCFCSYKCYVAKSMQKRFQTYKNNPELASRINQKRRAKLRDPEVRARIIKSYCNTLSKHPEIVENANKVRRRTLKNNPEIIRRSIEKRKRTLSEHPEIEERRSDALYQKMKDRGFISKEEQKLTQLLKDKYGEDDVIEQYRDIRYSKPGTNYRYACDCYIKSLDLFIEYNGSRFHPTEKDRNKLEEEVKRFKLKYPNRDIKGCQASKLLEVIDNDKIKWQVAKDNKLNYLIVTEGFKELYSLLEN